jgi:GTPase involved in cell partitioning and DNA repair
MRMRLLTHIALRQERTRRFIDKLRVVVRGGAGGSGCVSFARDKYVARGPPNGGNGGSALPAGNPFLTATIGRGGSVYVAATLSENHLNNINVSSFQVRLLLPPVFCLTGSQGERGGHGSGANRSGRTGEDRVIAVPPGTVVKDVSDLAQPFVIADLDKRGARVLVARVGVWYVGQYAKWFREESPAAAMPASLRHATAARKSAPRGSWERSDGLFWS